MSEGEFLNAGERIANKAATMGKVAVFIVAGGIKTVGGNAKDFDDRVGRWVDRLLGIYTGGSPQEWIDADLMWAEKHMVMGT